jgi:Flp pilus assembly protein TadD
MKIKLLMAGLLGLVSAATFAQKGELNNAQSSYDDYVVSSANGQKVPVLMAKANSSLDNAKTSIDKASTNEKTANLPLTFALKGAIYSALAVRDTVPATSDPLFSTAEEAVKKAKELDIKGDNKKLIDGANRYLAQYKLTEGVKEYQNKKFEQAYTSFDFYRQILPDDTNAIYYTALAAANAGSKDPGKYYPLAINNYKQLVTTKYSGNAKVYLDMSTLYIISKDTVNALKIAGEGVAKYPSNPDLRKREIEIALQTGKQSDILVKIQSAITNDPKNKTLYYYEGLTYSQIGDAANAISQKAKDAASANTQHQTALDNYTKAADMYKKALEIDPDYFEANLNLGYVLVRPAIDAYNAANKLPANKQKEYDDAIAKVSVLFDAAKPYLLKAVDLNPKSIDALTNLLSYYRGKKDNANAAKIKQQLDALK